MRALIAGVLLWLAPPAQAQSVEELQRLLKERDTKIRELNDRVEALEKRAQPEDDELDRALERTLVQQGALVLRPRSYELEPQLAYERWERGRSPLRYAWNAALAFRAGLGWQSQLQLHVPYVHAAATESTTALGDVSLSLLKQLARDEGRRPGLFATLAWVSRTGKDGFDGHVPTGGGFDIAQVGLTAVKRQDPLVYFAGASYSVPRSREISGVDVHPGNATGLRGGAVLAATPETSVNVGLNLSFVAASRVNGERVPDSDTLLGTLQLGFGTVLSRSMMVNVSGEFRVSGNVPNLRLVLGLPIRF
jgi:hypothetical protein